MQWTNLLRCVTQYRAWCKNEQAHFSLPELEQFRRYTDMGNNLKDKILIRDEVIQERDRFVVSEIMGRNYDFIGADRLLLIRSWNGDSSLSDSHSKKDEKRMLFIGLSNRHYRLYSVLRSRHYLEKLNIYHPDVI